MSRVIKIVLFIFIATSTVCAQSDHVKVDILFKDGTAKSGKAKIFKFSIASSRENIKFISNGSTTQETISSTSVDMITYYWNDKPSFTLKRAKYLDEIKGKPSKREFWYTVIKSCEDYFLLEYFEGLKVEDNTLKKLYEGGLTRLFVFKDGKEAASIVGYGVYWNDKDRLYEGGGVAKYNSKMFNEFSSAYDGVDKTLEKKEPISYSFLVDIFEQLCSNKK